jgi:hypothetical protein
LANESRSATLPLRYRVLHTSTSLGANAIQGMLEQQAPARDQCQPGVRGRGGGLMSLDESAPSHHKHTH